MTATSYTFTYRPGAIHHGPGVVDDLDTALEQAGCSRALVLTGSTIASRPAVIDPVTEGLGDHLVGVFDGVTSVKSLASAYEAAKRVREDEVDGLVGLGGGSSLDLAKITSVLAGHERPLEDVVDEIVAGEAMRVPEGELPDVFAVPTTLPGADLSQVAGVKLGLDPETTPVGEIPNGGVSDPRLMPAAVFHDLDLFATTPTDVLARSAMNGYDKALEMLYTRHRTPITDGAAYRGLRLLQSSLPAITDEPTAEADLSRILQGIALAQYGLSTPDAYRASIIHAFGHALSRTYGVQQGVAHAIAAPHVLSSLFERVDGRRHLLAEALGVDEPGADDAETARVVVEAVADTRDALGLPSRLRTVEEAERADFPDLARAVVDDSFMAAAPADLDADAGDIEAVFDEMW